MTLDAKTAGTYAVLFRTHFWDSYVERQYQRVRAKVGRGDLFILVDETSRPVSISHPNVVSHTQTSVLDLHLSGAGPLGPCDTLVRKPYVPSQIVTLLQSVLPT